MRRTMRREPRAVVMVIGANPEGSAAAHRLHAAGFAVVVLDDVDPAWTRRGPAYTDAWYVGTAELAGTTAVFCASVSSIPAVIDRGGAIEATTWSPGGVAAALRPVAVIDAREHVDGRRALLVRGHDVPDAALRIETAGSPAPFALAAPETGRFRTRYAIGDNVVAGAAVGGIGATPVLVREGGRLLGLAARGARVRAGQPVVEIDPRADYAACFGLEPEADHAASRAAETLLGWVRAGSASWS